MKAASCEHSVWVWSKQCFGDKVAGEVTGLCRVLFPNTGSGIAMGVLMRVSWLNLITDRHRDALGYVVLTGGTTVISTTGTYFSHHGTVLLSG